MNFQNSEQFAIAEDQRDSLASFKDYFYTPKKKGKETIYLCGNSLGLQPVLVQEYIEAELKTWKNYGVEGHFEGDYPWVSYHETTKSSIAALLGAETHEVVSMNNLTTNLHLMLASFYQPKGKRVKLLIESGAFPSDHYAAESHMSMKGIDPKEHLVSIKPKNGLLFTSDEICEQITALGDELALVLMPGVQYYTGQFFELAPITKAAHSVGAFIGFDLAHAIGNLPMNLHASEVDFAVWCSYKYLNSGPGGVSGVFVHERHGLDPNFPKLTGWWGHEPATRFKMDNSFKPAKGVDGWMLSNINIISMASHRAALQLFDEASIHDLRKKSIRLTGFLEFLLKSPETVNKVTVLTPENPEHRGCQLSISLEGRGKEVFNQLVTQGVICDWREPNVMRLAPTPLYNSFKEVWDFYQLFKELLRS